MSVYDYNFRVVIYDKKSQLPSFVIPFTGKNEAIRYMQGIENEDALLFDKDGNVHRQSKYYTETYC